MTWCGLPTGWKNKVSYLRQRKDNAGGKRYSTLTMSEQIKLSEIRVLDVLTLPNAARFFLNWKTACVGCGFARFCTLEDVTQIYHFDAQRFTEEVCSLFAQPNQRSTE